MAVDAALDVGLLKSEIKKTYASVSQEPEKDFVFPTGRAWAEDLDHPPELPQVPESAVESFAGVANPFSLGRLEPGERVLDLGSGAGTDPSSPPTWWGPKARSRDEGLQTGAERSMRAIDCPGGHHLEATDEEELFRLAREHVNNDHPEMQRSDEEIRQRVVADAYDT